MLVLFRLRRTALAAALVVTGGAGLGAAARAADARARTCPYGYFYSDGYCYPYSWYAPSYSDEGSDYANGGCRGGRHAGVLGGFDRGEHR
jgi:hypothetical protein